MNQVLSEEVAEDYAYKRDKQNIALGALVQGIFTLLSRVFGMTRDVIFFHLFGASIISDSFIVAFTIPNVLRRFFGEGAFGVAFVPVFTSTKESMGEEAAKNFFRDAFGILLLSLSLITIFGVIFSKSLVYLFAYGYTDNQAQFSLTNSMTKWLFPYAAMVSLVALFGAYLQCHRKFAAMAASPILLNIAMIASMFFLMEALESQVLVLCLGVLLGGLLQLALMIYNLKQNGLFAWPRFYLNNTAMKKLITLLLPALFGVFVYQLNIIILRQLVSFLGDGQISYYYNADRLTQFATGIFTVSISTAALPELSQKIANLSHKAFFDTLRYTLILTSFVVTPCALGLMFYAHPIVSVLYGHGAYTNKDAIITAHTLIAFAPSLLAFGLCRPIIQAFYANSDTRTPVKIGILTVILNLALGLILLRFEVVGIALTLSISSFMQYFFLIYLFKQKHKNAFQTKLVKPLFIHASVSIISCTLGLVLGSFGQWDLGFNIKNLIILIITVGFVALAYFFFSYLLKLEEAVKIVNIILKRLRPNRLRR